MSPEQVDARPLDHRSDVFALGTLLWEMLTARRLFHADSDFATLEKVRSAPIKPPSSRNERVPEEIDRIVLKALARDREERYQWASELADDLRAFLRTASPNYGEQKLSAWMVKNFPDELRVEREKVATFSRFVTVDDVYAYYAANPSVPASSGPSSSVAAADEEEDEATQVYDPSRHGSEPSDEVLAENALEPLPTVVQMADELGTGLPDIDIDISVDDGDIDIGGDPMASLVQPRQTLDTFDLPPPRRRRSRDRAAILILGVLVLAIAGLMFELWRVNTAVGTLIVQTTPTDGVEVYVDGERQPGTPPIRVEGLAPGPRLVELRHPDYEPILAEVDVAANSVTDLTRDLVPITDGEATVALALSDAQAVVYVDGSMVGGQGPNRSFQVSAGEPHVLEVVLPDHFVESYEFELVAEGRFERTVALRPVVGSITVGSDPAGEVFVDGESRGTTDASLTIGDLDVRRAYQLEIRPESRSFRPYVTTVVFDTYYDLRLRPRLPRRGTAETDDTVPHGFLATSGAPTTWYQVFVDGRDTGMVTPIPVDAPLALKAGPRSVSFVRPHDRRDTRVMITEGETTVARIPGE